MNQEEFESMVATLDQENRQLRARNERLEEELNKQGEPIAYFAKDKQGWWAETDKESGIPLYTAPKELSDEIVKELIDCLQEAVDGMGGAYAIWSQKARAILKKASEK